MPLSKSNYIGFCSVLLMLIVPCVIFAVAQSAEYQKNDLGTLGGGYDDSAANGINAHGQVVGFSFSLFHNVPDRAFLWQDGKMTMLPPLAGDLACRASAINDKEQVVGTCDSHAVLWEDGTPLNLGSLGGRSEAGAINVKGQIVGTSSVGGNDHAFFWQDGKMFDLGTLPGDTSSRALAINKRGQILGYSGSFHPFLWEGGVMQALSLPCCAQQLNDKGAILGSDRTAGAWVWEEGNVTWLGPMFPGTPYQLRTYATAINNRGQVVGYGISAGDVAFVWENGTFTLLGVDAAAYDINDKGQIVGYSAATNNTYHTVLWEEVKGH